MCICACVDLCVSMFGRVYVSACVVHMCMCACRCACVDLCGCVFGACVVCVCVCVWVRVLNRVHMWVPVCE